MLLWQARIAIYKEEKRVACDRIMPQRGSLVIQSTQLEMALHTRNARGHPRNV